MLIDPTQLPAQSIMIGLGLLAALATAVLVGLARRVDPWQVLGVAGLALLLGGVLSRLAWLLLDPHVDVAAVLRAPSALLDPRRGGYSSLGLLLGAGIAAAIASRSLSRPVFWRTLDALVPAGLVGLAFARVGCLANGCDFGSPAQLAWSVRYARHSPAWSHHLEAGVIDAGAAWSAPVHPLPLYLAGATLLIVSIVLAWGLIRRAAPGVIAVGSAAGYLLVRFVAEWWRADGTVIAVAGSLNLHHMIIGVGLVLVAALGYRIATCGKTISE